MLCLSVLPCQCMRDWYPALLSPAETTMQLFMWQRDTVGVAHYIMDVSRCLMLPQSHFICPGGWIDITHLSWSVPNSLEQM